MIYLHKILPLIFSPLILIIILIISGLILNSKKISILGLIFLVICSMPIISKKLIAYLESDYQLGKPSDVEPANAIVVLSGLLRTINSKKGLNYEFNEASDRIFAGIDLFKEKKSSKLILTRGKLPWMIGIPEGEYLLDVAIKYGVPKKNIILSKNVQNTEQEARAIKDILSIKDPKVILVTSAFHMKRAQSVFEIAGITVIPFAVDFRNEASKKTFNIMKLIPSAYSFNETNIFFREMLGRVYYNLKY